MTDGASPFSNDATQICEWLNRLFVVSPTSSDAGSVDAWIEREFAGYGLAVRRKDDPPIPGEPLMSMATAKELTRAAIAAFSALASPPPSGVREALEWDANSNRNYEPVELRAAKIYERLDYNGPGKKPEWYPHGNSLKQDEARHRARELLRKAGHKPALSQLTATDEAGREWSVALTERIMQLKGAGCRSLSIKAILGLINFVRDGEGASPTPAGQSTGAFADLTATTRVKSHDRS